MFILLIQVFTLPVDEMKEEARFWSLMFLALGATMFFGNLFSMWMFSISGENLTMRLRSRAFRCMLRQVRQLSPKDSFLRAFFMFSEEFWLTYFMILEAAVDKLNQNILMVLTIIWFQCFIYSTNMWVSIWLRWPHKITSQATGWKARLCTMFID